MNEPDTTVIHDSTTDELAELRQEMAELREGQRRLSDPLSPVEREAFERTEARIRAHLEGSAEGAKQSGRAHRLRWAQGPIENLLAEVESVLEKIPEALDRLAAAGIEDETVSARLMLIASDADRLTRYTPDPARASKPPTVKTTVRTLAEVDAAVAERNQRRAQAAEEAADAEAQAGREAEAAREARRESRKAELPTRKGR